MLRDQNSLHSPCQHFLADLPLRGLRMLVNQRCWSCTDGAIYSWLAWLFSKIIITNKQLKNWLKRKPQELYSPSIFYVSLSNMRRHTIKPLCFQFHELDFILLKMFQYVYPFSLHHKFMGTCILVATEVWQRAKGYNSRTVFHLSPW